MKIGIAALVVGYVLSQFYRAFLAVLARICRPIWGQPAQLADASGLWFLIFALMQMPIGFALDKIGPRRTVAVLLGLGGAGGGMRVCHRAGPGAISWPWR
jgi:sugar phosphate permease